MEPRALDPYIITLGGKEFEFFQSWWAIRQLALQKRKIKGGEPDELALDLLPEVLFNCCTNRGEMTLEDFERIIPGDAEWLAEHMSALQKHSAMQSRPRSVEETAQAPTNGSKSGPPVEPSST